MDDQSEFQRRVNHALSLIDRGDLAFNESEFDMIRSPYEYLEYYAVRHRLFNTAVALPLARGLHNGSYRKSPVVFGGESHRMPYVIHCLLTCRMLADLRLPLSPDEEDIVLAAALCHDMVEDLQFPAQGKELITCYGLDPRVYETVKKVSKRRDFTPEEEAAFFHGIEDDRLALLVKLSDRGNNVEDLYNMSAWKVHEYIGETRKWFLPMCEYGLKAYPELETSLSILQDKLVILTETAGILVDRYEARRLSTQMELQQLREENDSLRATWRALWKGDAFDE